MSSFLYRLGRTCYRRRWRVVAAWCVALLLSGLGAFFLHGKFDDQFHMPGAQSQVALDQLEMTFPQVAGSTANILVIAPVGTPVDSPQIRGKVESMLDKVKALDFINATVSPYDPMITGLISKDKTAAMATAKSPHLGPAITDAQRESILQLGRELQAEIPGSTVSVGGDMYAISMPHLSIVEVVGVGVAVLVLLFTFGSFLAAMMPITTALSGVGISMAILFAFTGLASVNSTTPMLALMLGLAVGIDYALFILSRHRDQLATGLDAEESAAQAVATAGSAVVFAGATVVIALLGLFITNIPFLGTMGAFAALAVAVAVAIALTLLPALMGLLGDRMRPKSRRWTRSAPARDPHTGPSGWWVRVVTKVPVLTIAVVLVCLAALTFPAKDMHLALPTSAHNPVGTPDRTTYDLTAKHFGPGFNGPLIVSAAIVESKDPRGIMKGLRQEIEAMPGVESVLLATPNRNADTGIVQVVPTTGSDNPATADLVHALRAKHDQWRDRYHVETAVTGVTAMQIDVSQRLADALVPFGIFVVGLSLVLLMMVFRSIWVPIKASLGFLLSVGGAMGATTLVFNKGWFRHVINLPEAEPIISFFPIILMGILFGLAMDYEVFLVSRMREEHVHGDDARAAVKDGFVHSAKVVVAAALIMFSVFAFFVPNGEGPIKPIAFGLAVGVALDAFVVRMTLVPAIMHLLGERAWWMPRWLDRLLPTFDVEGEGLRHQIDRRDWPRAGAQPAIHAEGLTAGDARGIDVSVEPGEALVVTGPPRARTPLLAALAGRMRPEAGEAKVAGRLLATQAGEIRGATTWVDATTPSPARAWVRGQVVVVDDADRLDRTSLAALGQLATSLGERTLVVGTSDPDALAGVLPESTRLLRLDDPAEGAPHVLA